MCLEHPRERRLEHRHEPDDKQADKNDRDEEGQHRAQGRAEEHSDDRRYRGTDDLLAKQSPAKLRRREHHDQSFESEPHVDDEVLDLPERGADETEIGRSPVARSIDTGCEQWRDDCEQKSGDSFHGRLLMGWSS